MLKEIAIHNYCNKYIPNLNNKYMIKASYNFYNIALLNILNLCIKKINKHTYIFYKIITVVPTKIIQIFN
jgi:hypothetical protein